MRLHWHRDREFRRIERHLAFRLTGWVDAAEQTAANVFSLPVVLGVSGETSEGFAFIPGEALGLSPRVSRTIEGALAELYIGRIFKPTPGTYALDQANGTITSAVMWASVAVPPLVLPVVGIRVADRGALSSDCTEFLGRALAALRPVPHIPVERT